MDIMIKAIKNINIEAIIFLMPITFRTSLPEV